MSKSTNVMLIVQKPNTSVDEAFAMRERAMKDGALTYSVSSGFKPSVTQIEVVFSSDFAAGVFAGYARERGWMF